MQKPFAPERQNRASVIWNLTSQLPLSLSQDYRRLFTLPTLVHASTSKDLSSFLPPGTRCSVSTNYDLDIEVSLLSKHHSRYSCLHFFVLLNYLDLFTGLLFISLHSPILSSAFEANQRKNLTCLSYYPSSPVLRVHIILYGSMKVWGMMYK